uniref:Putative adenylate cyclase-coupled calcitonin receptor n=1 Tax=Nyssomyia neivai TaxID=330878 RepID=A0A1L8DJU9_9DIPT
MTSSSMSTTTTEHPLILKRLECLEELNKSAISLEDGTYCPGTFDGWLCWPNTEAGTAAFAPCPEFVTGFDPSRYAHKECGTDGVWFRHPLTNKTWSNYTTCVNLDDFEWRQQVNLIYEIGYSISLIAILLSLVILGYFRSLKCSRITLHMNLFSSFAANNSLWLLWYRVVLGSSEVLENNEAGCAVLHLVLHYFLLTNYAWMLCEGFYLHTVLVAAFVSEKKLVKWLIWLGWGAPAIVIVQYGLLRGLHGDETDTMQCWANETSYTNILVAPVVISMLLNLLFLCNIVRVLLLKLKAPAGLQGGGPSRTVLQAFRATLLLVPLLGLQYILTPFRPAPGHPWERVYETVSAFTASFQGLCVASLFCFFNGEVMAQVKRKWRTLFFRPRANSYTATQVSSAGNGSTVDDDNHNERLELVTRVGDVTQHGDTKESLIHHSTPTDNMYPSTSTNGSGHKVTFINNTNLLPSSPAKDDTV